MFRKRYHIVIWGIITLILISFITPGAHVYAASIEDDYEWIENGDGTAMITEYIGTDIEVFIPQQLNGHTVIDIGEEAFKDKQLVAIEIPNSVERIERGAFANNSIVNLALPNSVTYMGSSAFENNLLESIILPENMTHIADSVFGQNNLTEFTIPESVASIGSYAFADNMLTTMTIPDSVSTLGYGAFKNNQLESITLSSNLYDIPDEAFAENNLTHITLPSNTSKIGMSAFMDNQLTELTIPNRVREIGLGAFAQNKLTKIVIPRNVEKIYDAVFYMNELETVVILNDQLDFADLPNPDPVFPLPPTFADNQADPAHLTIIAPAGSTAEAYASEHHFSFLDLATSPPMVGEVEAIVYASNIETNRRFDVYLQVSELIPISGAVDHHVQVYSDREGLILDDHTQFNYNGSHGSMKTIELRLSERGKHQLTISVDGIAANPVTVDVSISANTMNQLKRFIDEANVMLQAVTIGTEPGQYADREAVNDFADAVALAEAVYESLHSTEAEISAASSALIRAMSTFGYFQVTVADMEPMTVHHFVSDGGRYVLPDRLDAVTYIVYKDDVYGTMTSNGRAEVSVMWFSDTILNEQVTQIDLGRPSVYELIGRVDYYGRWVELTIVVLEGEVPVQKVIGNKAMLEFDNGTLVRGLPAGATVHGADITLHAPYKDDITPAGDIMKFIIDGVAGPLHIDILIPIALSADPDEVGIVYFNDSESRWEFVFGSEVVNIEGKLYAKATITHNSVYGVAIIDAELVVNGLRIADPVSNATQLQLPELPAGFTAKIDWSSDEDVIDLNGVITPPNELTVVELDILVQNEHDDRDYDWLELLINVPARSTVSSVGFPTPANQAYIAGADGGTLTLSDVILTFPANTMDGTIIVSVQKISNSSHLPLPEDAIFASAVYEVTKNREGTFSKAITITLPFDVALVDLDGYDIAVYWLNEETNEWKKLDHIIVDSEHNTVSGEIDHFTKFSVLATKKQTDSETVQLSDIAGHWAEADIISLVDTGAIKGYPDGSFSPDNHMTRAEFASVLVKAFSLTADDGKYFSDTINHWSADTIAIAAAHGIITGYNETYFGPDDFITREQMAVMIARIAQLGTQAESMLFTDVDAISKWAFDAISETAHAEIITGYPDNTFRPQTYATRAEAVTVISKALVQ